MNVSKTNEPRPSRRTNVSTLMIRRRAMTTALSALVSLTPFVALANDPGQSPTIVFDSMPNTNTGGEEFLPNVNEFGAAVELSGSARNVTQIDLLQSGFYKNQYLVRFYDLDSASGAPSHVIWESPPQTLGFEGNGRVLSSIQVPDVLVPDRMAYSIVEYSTDLHVGIWGATRAAVGTAISGWDREN